MTNNAVTIVHSTVSGWVSTPDSRGTMDIIWSSFLTIFLCTWTAVCLNIPHPNDSKRDVFIRKAKWMFWAIVGPEIVLAVAIGQYASARRSKKRFHRLGYKNWTIRHGFFADMGGILLQPKESSPFVVNGRQLAYLVEKEYIKCPDITAEEIWDKSKADTLGKLITLVQASWLVIQLLGRAALRLSTTTLELSAGAIVFCTFGTFFCWLHKPADVQRGIVVTTDVTTAQILIDAGPVAAAPYRHTPLDFVARESFTCSYDVMGFVNRRWDHPERPLRKFPNDRFPDICTFEKFALFCLTSAYAASHMIAWNFSFPTQIELLLWRISSSLFTGVTVFFWIFETCAARQRFGRWDKYLIWLRLKKNPDALQADEETVKVPTRQDTINRLDAFEQEQRKAKPILMWELALLAPVVLLYSAARGYMIVEVFCDGERPACRSCVERETTCGYDPPTGTLLAQAQKRKIEELETDRSSLYEVLWYLQTASPSKATALLRHMRAAQGEDLGVIFRNFEMNRPSSSMSAAAPETDASKGYASSVINDSSSSVMLSMPEVMDHPNFSVAQKKQFNMTAITLLAPNQQDASVDKINGPLDMFFGCVGALFYIMNKDDVQISIAAMKASGNGHIPLGDVLTNGSNIQLRTYAAELAGMAAIGVVHSQLADPETAPPPELADYFYAVAKHGLDSAISFSPLRAMKICSLLGMYNIVVKATVALAYIDPVIQDITSTQDELDVPPEDMIRRECVKVSIIKASLLRRLPTKAPVLEGTILEYRVRLSRFHARLPDWMSIASLLGGENTELMATFRPVIYYVHLFYLSAMMLLSRRLIIAYIPLDAIGSVTLPSEAQRAIEEGYQAAETNASVMDLMLQEGKVVQVCWLCIYTSYTAGIMIAHKASQNALHNEPFAHGMVLLSKYIGVLGYCAIKDALAGKFHDILTEHMSMLRQYESTLARSGNSATPSSSSSNDSLFIFQRGSSNLHIAALNLLRTIHHPFGGLRDVTAQNTLSNRAETTMGTHLEWEYELESRDLAQARPKDSKLADTVDAKIESMTPLCSSSEQDAPMQKLLAQPQGEAWTKWTPATWQNSFHMPQK
ncbi:unnamed protein product [Alternaria alternata]